MHVRRCNNVVELSAVHLSCTYADMYFINELPRRTIEGTPDTEPLGSSPPHIVFLVSMPLLPSSPNIHTMELGVME